jgi:ADP-ribose pyrophosphatase YjhB (NUDIX family)
VRRRRYGGEVGLPKGKAHAEEDLRTAALREVKEETGYDTEIVGHAGTTHYMVGPRSKAVSYFRMRLSGSAAPAAVDTEEIDRVGWATPREALALLTHAEDRRLISAVFSLRPEERA